MSKSQSGNGFSWLRNGDEAFAAMLQAIAKATDSVHFETYTFKQSPLGFRFREALMAACQRGVRVHVMIDFFGSTALPESFWTPLVQAGGHFRWFNPWNLFRLGIRNHRKILVIDRAVAVIGGINVAPEFEGDGISQGWRDFALRIEGPLAHRLAGVCEDLYQYAEFLPKLWQKLRKSPFNRRIAQDNWTILLSGPGRGKKHLKRSLTKDINKARSVGLMTAYFLPTWKLRRSLIRAARKTGRVNLLLAGRTDLPFTRMAAQCLYKMMLRAGARIHEYRAQILHGKLLVIDNCVYVGSANLDHRSLNINYEILVRIEDAELAREAREYLNESRRHARAIRWSAWKKVRPWWQRWMERAAYVLLSRIDPYVTRWRARHLP